jgi:hypothetical protein
MTAFDSKHEIVANAGRSLSEVIKQASVKPKPR